MSFNSLSTGEASESFFDGIPEEDSEIPDDFQVTADYKDYLRTKINYLKLRLQNLRGKLHSEKSTCKKLIHELTTSYYFPSATPHVFYKPVQQSRENRRQKYYNNYNDESLVSLRYSHPKHQERKRVFKVDNTTSNDFLADSYVFPDEERAKQEKSTDYDIGTEPFDRYVEEVREYSPTRERGIDCDFKHVNFDDGPQEKHEYEYDPVFLDDYDAGSILQKYIRWDASIPSTSTVHDAKLREKYTKYFDVPKYY